MGTPKPSQQTQEEIWAILAHIFMAATWLTPMKQTPKLGRMAQQRWLQHHSGAEQKQHEKKTQHQVTQEAGDDREELIHEQYDSMVAIVEEKVEWTTTGSHLLSPSSTILFCLQVSPYRGSVTC